jgi:hypothetical protein
MFRGVSTWFWWGKMRAGKYMGDPGLNNRILLKCVSAKTEVFELDSCGSEIELKWSHVKRVMNFRVS